MNEDKFYEVVDRLTRNEIDKQLRRRDQMPFYVRLVIVSTVLVIVLAAISESNPPVTPHTSRAAHNLRGACEPCRPDFLK